MRPYCKDSKPTEQRQLSSGWSYGEVFSLANNISLARMASGPLLAYWIVQDQWTLALIGLVLAGASDWADGYFAARYKQSSVLGSYLDPIADKVLMACVIGALGFKSIVSPAVVAVIVSRDVLLILGGFYHRASMLNWQVVPFTEFFRLTPSTDTAKASAPRMKPIFISKVNTVFQLAVVAACVGKEVIDWPPVVVVDVLVGCTLATTMISGVQYLIMYRKGSLL